MKYVVLFLVFLLSVIHAAKESRRDFEFRDIAAQAALAAIAKLEGKAIKVPEAISAKHISFSIKDATPFEAISDIVEKEGYIAIDLVDRIDIEKPVRRAPAEIRPDADAAAAAAAKKPGLAVIKLRSALAKELEPNIKTFVGAEGTVSINEAANALILNVPPQVLSGVRELIQQLDRELTQVYIEAKIVETNSTMTRALGIEWGAPIGNTSVAGLNFNAGKAGAPLMAGASIGLGNNSQIQARLSALEEEGKVKIISSPKITTLSGVPAVVESATVINVRTLAAVQATTAGAASAISGGLQTVKAGLNLRVTPFAISDQQVRLDLTISKSDPDWSKPVDGIPGISDNSAATSLIVGDGQVATIGGLTYQSRSDSTMGVPWLSKLPILGFFFASYDKEEKDRELLIFLTPKVLRGAAN